MPEVSETTESIGLRWLIGAYALAMATSLLACWLIGSYFLSSPNLREFDSVTNRAVPIAGHQVRMRSEGWATTVYGQHGFTLKDEGKLQNANLNVVLWGDSYVQALQVSEDVRMQNVAEKELREKQVNVVAVADSGLSIADYYFMLPRYENLVPNRAGLNLFFLGSLNDVLPDDASSLFSSVTINDSGEIQWNEETGERLVSSAFENRLNSFHPYFFRSLIRQGKKALPLRLYRNQHSKSNVESEQAKSDIRPYFRRMLTEFRSKSSGQIAFIYAPHVPAIEGGELSRDHDERDLALAFEEICRELNIPFRNLEEDFIESFDANQKFARGFDNTKPGYGHLNEFGHKIAGEAIAQLIRNSDALHSN